MVCEVGCACASVSLDACQQVSAHISKPVQEGFNWCPFELLHLYRHEDRWHIILAYKRSSKMQLSSADNESKPMLVSRLNTTLPMSNSFTQ
jgi:hypothetical protein